ncbi:hypothetical protein [Clostridium butyricum]|nr:hypothetical protein [Clostridium butyricum]
MEIQVEDYKKYIDYKYPKCVENVLFIDGLNYMKLNEILHIVSIN